MVRSCSTLALGLCLFMAGCTSTPTSRRILVSPYQPTNFYLRQPSLPADILRVAVLPLPPNGRIQSDSSSREALEPVLAAELRKRKRFEVLQVSPQDLSAWTGRTWWSDTQDLPAALLKTLRKHTGCDAVLFASISTFHAYPPLAIGWNLKLVDCKDGQVWWSVDEVFDAGSESVAAAAEAYGRKELTMPAPLLENSAILDSPRRFGQYTAWAVASTLPSH